VVRAVPARAVAMAVASFLARDESIQRGDQVVVRARADLDDHQPGGRMRDVDRQQPVSGTDLVKERLAGAGQVRQPPFRAGPNRQLACVYGKTLRSASRSRPNPPRAGADS
jgi:hypothetical protein